MSKLIRWSPPAGEIAHAVPPRLARSSRNGSQQEVIGIGWARRPRGRLFLLLHRPVAEAPPAPATRFIPSRWRALGTPVRRLHGLSPGLVVFLADRRLRGGCRSPGLAPLFRHRPPGVAARL